MGHANSTTNASGQDVSYYPTRLFYGHLVICKLMQDGQFPFTAPQMPDECTLQTLQSIVQIQLYSCIMSYTLLTYHIKIQCLLVYLGLHIYVIRDTKSGRHMRVTFNGDKNLQCIFVNWKEWQRCSTEILCTRCVCCMKIAPSFMQLTFSGLVFTEYVWREELM